MVDVVTNEDGKNMTNYTQLTMWRVPYMAFSCKTHCPASEDEGPGTVTPTDNVTDDVSRCTCTDTCAQSMEEVEKAVQRIQAELLLQKAVLSSTIRKKVSIDGVVTNESLMSIYIYTSSIDIRYISDIY